LNCGGVRRLLHCRSIQRARGKTADRQHSYSKNENLAHAKDPDTGPTLARARPTAP
jgi:hypothetical protein